MKAGLENIRISGGLAGRDIIRTIKLLGAAIDIQYRHRSRITRIYPNFNLTFHIHTYSQTNPSARIDDSGTPYRLEPLTII